MLDRDTRAAKSFYRQVRKFAESVKSWDATAVWYETKPDEAHDLTLVSQRVYGRRDEVLAVMAAAGLDTPYQPLPQKRIALPSDGLLMSIKRRTGFESVAQYRRDFAPTWMES